MLFDDLATAFWQASAPATGAPDSYIAPEGVVNDPLGVSRAGIYQQEKVSNHPQGFIPNWKWVSPPGVGDAPQHVWNQYNLAPVSLEGPGDRPATYLCWKEPLTIVNFAMRWQGMGVDGGNFLMTGLYVPNPLDMVSQDYYANGG